MAYFPNSSAGAILDAQCSKCRFGDKPCPIAMAQMHLNYDAVGNITATKILDMLVDDEDGCRMFQLFTAEMTVQGVHVAEDGAPLFDPSVGPPAPVERP